MHDTDQTSSYEIVNVLVRKTDYEELRKSGVPKDEQVAMALRHYLKLMEQTKLVPVVFNGDATTFRCGLPKELCESIRTLGGRFDLHVMEAVRLWLH